MLLHHRQGNRPTAQGAIVTSMAIAKGAFARAKYFVVKKVTIRPKYPIKKAPKKASRGYK